MPQVIEDTVLEQTNLLTAELEWIAVQLDQLWQDSLAAGSSHAMGLPRFDGQVDYAASRRGCCWICCSYSTGVR